MTSATTWTSTWAPSAATRASGVVVVLLGCVLGLLTDGPGRLLLVPLVLGVVAALVRAQVLSPLLAVGPDGWRVVSGTTVHELGWDALVGATVRRHRGRSLEIEVLLEGDDEPSLVVLGLLSLGAEPSAVLPLLLQAQASAAR